MRRFLKYAFFSLSSIATLLYIFSHLLRQETQILYDVPTGYDVSSTEFSRTLGILLGPPLLNGNQVTELLNGDQIFPSMLEAISKSESTITFETYIYWSGEIGLAFAKALSERAQAGVKVHILLDWVGSSKMNHQHIDMMRQAGAEVEYYRPLRWFNIARIGSRTHRKLLIIDGKVGFTGGVGVGDVWLGHGQSPNHWRDSHYKLEGPAVAHMQAAFMDNWIKTHKDVLYGDKYFPALENQGSSYAQVFKSSMREGSASVRLMYLLFIANARKSILISNAYFVPDELTVDMLVAARKRGVVVELILPGPNMDMTVVRKASRSLWGRLLKAGVKIYEYRPTMYHCKVMIVDGMWVSVGSTNFDDRSFQLNDEANLNILDRDFAERQIAIFMQDRQRSYLITYQEWLNRPLKEKITENAVGLFRTWL